MIPTAIFKSLAAAPIAAKAIWVSLLLGVPTLKYAHQKSSIIVPQKLETPEFAMGRTPEESDAITKKLEFEAEYKRRADAAVRFVCNGRELERIRKEKGDVRDLRWEKLW